MSRASSVGVLCIGLLATTGCPERALEIPDDGGGRRDLAVRDLSSTDLPVTDLSVLPDLATDDRPPPNPCPAGTEFIFTIDEDTTLSRFNPVSSLFFDVGQMACPTVLGGSPNSMAIDRMGNGWVNYSSGELFRLVTSSLSCTSTPYAPGQGGLISFGMSFSQDLPGSTAETLWITDSQAGVGGQSLASVNLSTFTLSSQIPLFGGTQPELTGDDDANVWGFFPSTTPPRMARIDKKFGTLDRTILLPMLSGNPRAWGVAAWKGDFFVFLQRESDPSTRIYRVDGTTGVLTTVVSNTNRRIVGVGVATCAGNN